MECHLRIAALPFPIPVNLETQWCTFPLKPPRYHRYPEMRVPESCFREIIRHEHWLELEEAVLNREQLDVRFRSVSDRPSARIYLLVSPSQRYRPVVS